MTKLLIYLAVWKRPEITELCFVGINRLKQHPDFEIEALAVISEDSMIPLCEKYGVNWVMAENTPLGKKKNAGLQKAKEFDFDYLMEIGSDDLILNELLTDYKNYIGKYEFFGINDAAYINSETGDCRRLISNNSTYGAGRMIHRKILESVSWKLWSDHINRGLDNNSILNLIRKGIGYKKVAVMDFPGVIDVKSKENIWKFNYYLGVEYDKQEIFNRLSREEVRLIESYVKVESESWAA
jgi:hypothetical protein